MPDKASAVAPSSLFCAELSHARSLPTDTAQLEIGSFFFGAAVGEARIAQTCPDKSVVTSAFDPKRT
jgi:hypothetical protein